MNNIEQLQKEFKWLNEPSIIDNTFSPRNESMIGFLSRSTVDAAKKSRVFLRYNIPFLPKHYQREFCNRFENNWHSSLFELIVYRMLQELGAKLSIEEQLDTGKKPDFKASLDNTTFLVEATSPFYNKVVDKSFSENSPLLEIIEDNCPEGWCVMVSALPAIGLSESKKEFQKAIINEFQNLKKSKSDQPAEIKINKHISKGLIDIILYSNVFDSNAKLLNEPVITFFSDANEGIQRTLHNKRKQVKNSKIPAIIAINLNFRTYIGECDTALFGQTVTTVYTNGNSRESFEATGYFGKSANKDSQPTIAGVIAFPEAGFLYTDKPVLYWNPRYKGKIPNSFNKLPQKSLTDNKSICFKSVEQNILGALYP